MIPGPACIVITSYLLTDTHASKGVSCGCITSNLSTQDRAHCVCTGRTTDEGLAGRINSLAGAVARHRDANDVIVGEQGLLEVVHLAQHARRPPAAPEDRDHARVGIDLVF